jgi:hypothetical protein
MTTLVLGVAVLDNRQGLPVVVEVFPEYKDTASGWTGSEIERMMYVALDEFDVKLEQIEHQREEAVTYNSSRAESELGSEHGFYIGQLATVQNCSVYGYITSVNKRILLAVKEDRTKEKLGDVTLRDILAEVALVYMDHLVANPFPSVKSKEAFCNQIQGTINKYLGGETQLQ